MGSCESETQPGREPPEAGGQCSLVALRPCIRAAVATAAVARELGCCLGITWGPPWPTLDRRPWLVFSPPCASVRVGNQAIDTGVKDHPGLTLVTGVHAEVPRLRDNSEVSLVTATIPGLPLFKERLWRSPW